MIGEYLFHIGSFGVPSMGFCILVGTILAMFLCYYAKRFSSLDWNDEILDGVIWAVIGGFIGMKVLYWIVTPDEFLAVFRDFSWKRLLSLITSGMVFYGGLVGGVAGLLLLCRKRKRNFFTFADLILPCFCVAHAGGRIGCLLVGCCYGVAEGQSCFGGLCTYHGALAVRYLNGTMRLPVPLLEAIFLLLLAGLLLFLLKINKHRGTVTGWYLVLYAIWRFFIEYFRGDEVRGIYGVFSTSQWISIAILAAGVVILVLSRKWPKDEPIREFAEDDLVVPPEEPEPMPEQEMPEEPDEVAETEDVAAVEEVAETADAGEEIAAPDAAPASDDGAGDSAE
ncbi:MAG: prolipoprotein diacylglyceryl transferase [Clostridia bacterium]|nr:prolipoprotein diacylglyceryl transferase [Clostridia bacterium]